MNKTYIANENHPELKTGLKVELIEDTWMWSNKNYGGSIHIGWSPINEPDWYDEVKEEKSNCNCSVNVCKNCNEGKTVSEDEIGKIMFEIVKEFEYPGDYLSNTSTNLKIDPLKLATYLAKLEKSIKAYKGE
jgi:hypothetical protein